MSFHEELNLFVFDYLTNDKTNTALLLDGEWGTGKTYYVKNVLMPFLEGKKKQVVYVSLYGIEDAESLSKNIFTESRLKAINSTAMTIISGTAKTVIRGVSSYFGVDLNGGAREWKKLAKFANLKDKLLIIDDLERHSPKFNIIEILGYINNLCEQDGIKVLLVCDERSLGSIGLPEEELTKYKKIKEKTVGDTIKFLPNLDESIASILKNFDLSYLGDQQKLIKDLKTINNEKNINCFNLRSFSRACQKMFGILSRVKDFQRDDNEVFLDFIKTSFFGLVAFYLRLSKDSSLSYLPNYGMSSSELGTSRHPLYRYAYDYCIYQIFDIFAFKQAYLLFLKQRQSQKNNKVISIIQSYYLVNDDELANALAELNDSIANGSITCESFTGIATYLIAIKHHFKYDIDKILSSMIERVQNEPFSQKLIDSLDSFSGYYLDEKDCINDFDDFKNRLKNAILPTNIARKSNHLNAENLSQFIENIYKNKDRWMISREGFSTYINFQELLDFIERPECDARCLDEIRGMFLSLYSGIANIVDFCFKDLAPIKEIKAQINNLQSKCIFEGKAKKLQLKWLSQNLDNILCQLEKGGDEHERI